MKRPRFLTFTVTNDLSYDQRMIRICTSLAAHGYHVTLIGRSLSTSIPLRNQPYHQKRLPCFFTKGFLFYAEFNIRLFFYLLFSRNHLLCAVDLDTILPVLLVSRLKGIPRVYDAHELFCEMKEVVTRPRIYRFWKRVEKYAVPRFIHGYTVNSFIASQFHALYGVNYDVIRNMPLLIENISCAGNNAARKTILYQGAVNEARCFESLVPAMNHVDAQLIICGNGNFMEQAIALVDKHHLQHKVMFTGWLDPEKLKSFTQSAYVGVNIIEDNGLNNRFSLSNRFFDYIQSALPQVCVAYPAYKAINEQHECALLISDTSPKTIAAALNRLLVDNTLYQNLKTNCLVARLHYNWNIEEPRLINFYHNILQ